MPKEQEAIERLNSLIKVNKDFFENQGDMLIDKRDIQAIETVLSMLKEKDEKIEYYKKQKDYDDQFKHELLEHIRCLNLDNDKKDKELEKKDKIIDLLAKAFKQDDVRTVKEIK